MSSREATHGGVTPPAIDLTLDTRGSFRHALKDNLRAPMGKWLHGYIVVGECPGEGYVGGGIFLSVVVDVSLVTAPHVATSTTRTCNKSSQKESSTKRYICQ